MIPTKTAMRSQPEATTRTSCPSCGGISLEVIYQVTDIPAHSCILLDSQQEARDFPRRDLQLTFCSACGLIFNRLFDTSVMEYSTNFEESQHFSGTFSGFARGLAREIAEECCVGGKQVLEIGCGKGDFLLELCQIGECAGIGIDPGFRSDRIAGKDRKRVRFLVDFFGPGHLDLPADLIICRHTLEHIPEVAEFVRLVYRLAERNTEAQVVFETPDVERVLREGAFWDIYYEHCSYFSSGTHARLFRHCGFDVTRLDLVYDRQYIVQTARIPSNRLEGRRADVCNRLPLEADLERIQQLAEAFPQRVATVQAAWLAQVRGIAANNQRTVLWGGGSKGVSFLTTLGLREEIDSVVDINPFKQGKYMPGSGHVIVSPEQLLDHPPAVVIVMNPIYVSEVRATLNELGLAPEVMTV